MRGVIITATETLARKLAFTVEVKRADVRRVVDEGAGPHTQIPELRVVYDGAVSIRRERVGERVAVILGDTASRARLAALRDEIAARKTSGKATALDLELDALPSEQEIGEDWV